MGKLMFLLLAVCFLATLPVSGHIVDVFDEEYACPIPAQLPSVQAMAEIEQMSDYGKELRGKPGGGEGIGEVSIFLNLKASNVLALIVTCVVFAVLKRYRKKKQAINNNLHD